MKNQRISKMPYYIISDIAKINFQKWEHFVYNHPNGTIFQTPEMYRIYEKTQKYDPVFLAAFDDANEMAGCLIAVIQKEHAGFLGKFTARSIIMGGPLILNNNPEIADFLLKHYNREISSKVVYSQFRNLYDLSFLHDIFIKNGYCYEEHLNILVDLTKTEEKLWKEISPKGRNKIQHAIKSGLEVKESIDNKELDSAYSILQEVYNRAGVPLADKKLFENAFEILIPNNMIKLMGIYWKNQLIGMRILLSYKKTLYDWYAGSYSNYLNKHPNDILPWKIFLQAKEEGYEQFDFGGAGKPDISYGVRDYKLKFGGTVVNFGRYELIYKPFLMFLGKTGLKIYKMTRFFKKG